jgi:hypothetical protein
MIAFGLLMLSSWQWNKSRTEKIFSFTLFPNCLLTRHPVVFVDGKKSVFYFGKFWNFIPDYIADHGYEVIDLTLPWRNSASRLSEIENFLQVLSAEKMACHFFIDPSSDIDFRQAAKKFPEAVRSITLATDLDFTNEQASGGTPFFLWLHQMLLGKKESTPARVLGLDPSLEPKICGKIYLKHCVQLAEQDLQQDKPIGEFSHEPTKREPLLPASV